MHGFIASEQRVAGVSAGIYFIFNFIILYSAVTVVSAGIMLAVAQKNG